MLPIIMAKQDANHPLAFGLLDASAVVVVDGGEEDKRGDSDASRYE